jgi:unsaturated chondroitin disaccharide hydrolase
MKLKFFTLLSAITLQCSFGQLNYDAELKSASSQLLQACKAYNDTINAFPRGNNPDGTFRGTHRKDWTSGFFGGNLWYAYEATGDKALLLYAKKWTYGVWQEQYTTDNHDVGFMVYCSFGNMLRLTKDKSVEKVIVQAAKSLTGRYNPIVGCTKSWDYHESWNPKLYSVIIDNMMIFWIVSNSVCTNYYPGK